MGARSRVRVYIASSLDGFIAGPGDDLSWLDGANGEPVPEVPQDTGALGFEAFMAEVGALLMGRRTYDVVKGFGGPWPYGDRPVLVATHRPLEGDDPRILAVTGDIHQLLSEARQAAGEKDVYIDGGALIRQAADAGAIDEYVITFAPIVLGQGVPLFAGLERRQPLEILAHHDFGQGMVQVVARPRRSGEG